MAFLKSGMFVVILDGRETFIFKKTPNLANFVFASRIRQFKSLMFSNYIAGTDVPASPAVCLLTFLCL